jgi:putative tricarboxylic transport membrane protein
VTHTSELSPATAHLGFWLGLAGLAVANAAIFASPGLGIALSFLACAIAVAAGWTGDRFFAGATAMMAAANWFMLNSIGGPGLAGIPGLTPLFIAALIFALAPVVVMLLRNAGQLGFAGVPAELVDQPPFVRNPQDFFGGVALLQLAIFAWRASADLPGQQGFAFGPGTAPRLFIFLLAVNAFGIMIHGLVVPGPHVERYAFRGPFFITAGIFVFAITIRSLGLVLSTFLLVLVSAAGSAEVRWIETAIWGAVLSAFCSVLFPKLLNLPMQLWPWFW